MSVAQRRFWVARARDTVFVVPTLGVLALLRAAGLVAEVNLVLVGTVLCATYLGATVVGTLLPDDGPRWQLWMRLGVQMAGTTASSYLLGWGPALALGYAAVASDTIRQCGSRAVRPALVFAFGGLALGQLGVAAGVFPTLIATPLVHGLAVLAALALVPTVVLLGWSTASREQSERTAILLLGLADQLAQPSERDEVCQRVAEAVPLVVGLDQAVVFLWDPVAETMAPVGVHGLGPDLAARLRSLVVRPRDTPLLRKVVDQPTTRHFDAETTEDPWLRDVIETFGTDEFFVVPITSGGQTLGVITAGRADTGTRGLSAPELARLAGLAAQAAIALENARLLEQERAALERLREADRLKSEFLAVVSHELRTPLAVMLGAARTLQWRRGEVDDRMRDDLIDSVVRRGDQLDRLVKDLLEASGDIQLELGEVDLAAAVRTAITDAVNLHPGRRIETAADREVLVQADALRVRQVLDNLLANAAKYAPGAEVRIDVGLAGDEGWLSVTDRGPGMTAEQAARAFDPFWQGDSSSVRRAGGLGLGLHICRRIVQAHGGRIWIESEPGRGTLVKVTLPVAGPPPAQRPDVTAPARGWPTATEDVMDRSEATDPTHADDRG